MKKFIIPVILSATTITGCSNSVPECSATETTDLVKQIADREMANQLGAEAAAKYKYSVNSIRTTNTNEQTGNHQCAAQLDIIERSTGESNEIPITYTIEMTDDGKEFYVNVLGL